jgi:Na+-translocating ferredoxin:NAD+ oxidoreductase subunit C
MLNGDEWDESIDRSETIIRDCHLSSEEIIQKIKDMGVVGLGGALSPRM